jgi:hypothetical protein
MVPLNSFRVGRGLFRASGLTPVRGWGDLFQFLNAIEEPNGACLRNKDQRVTTATCCRLKL